MTLRQRTALVVLATCTVAVIVVYFTVQTMMAAHSRDLERQKANGDLEQASNALNLEVAGIETAVAVRAHWDDTYQFMEDRNAEYIASNVQASTLANLGINFMVFVDPAGQMAHWKAIDLSDGSETSIPSGLEPFVTGEGILARHPNDTSSVSGILFLPEHLALVASQPILTSQNEGPIAGSLVMGRYLDSEEVQRLSARTGMSIELHRVDEADIPPHFAAARSSLSQDEASLVQVMDGNTIAAYSLVNEVHGNPAFVLGISEPRDIYAQGQQTAHHVLYLLLGLSALFTILLILGIDLVVMSRLRRLAAEIDRAANSRDASDRVLVRGRDEATAVAKAVNLALASLEQSRHDLAASETRNRALVEAIPDLVFRIDGEGRIFETKRPQKAASAGDNHDSPHDRGCSDEIIDLIPTQIQQIAMPHVKKALESRETQIFEFQMSVDGRVSYHEARVLANGDHDALVMVRDVTDQKHAEESQQNSLLLREIHNRVKNHLQLIRSFPEAGHRQPRSPDAVSREPAACRQQSIDTTDAHRYPEEPVRCGGTEHKGKE